MTEEMFTPDQMKPANNKIITTAKCPICGEMATVYKFGKGQGRISHHGHSVCFSSREVRALIEPEREPEREPKYAPVDPAETKMIEPERQPEAAPPIEPEKNIDDYGTLTFGVF